MFSSLLSRVTAQARPLWHVHEVSFEFKRTSGTREATFAYILAKDAGRVIPILENHLATLDARLVNVIDPPRVIPLEKLDQHLSRLWPEFENLLPTQAQLTQSKHKQKIYLLPSIVEAGDTKDR